MEYIERVYKDKEDYKSWHDKFVLEISNAIARGGEYFRIDGDVNPSLGKEVTLIRISEFETTAFDHLFIKGEIYKLYKQKNGDYLINCFKTCPKSISKFSYSDYKFFFKKLIFSKSSIDDWAKVKDVFDQDGAETEENRKALDEIWNKIPEKWEGVNDFKLKSPIYTRTINKENHIKTRNKFINLKPIGKFVKIITKYDGLIYGKVEKVSSLHCVILSPSISINETCKEFHIREGVDFSFMKEFEIISETEYIQARKEFLTILNF